MNIDPLAPTRLFDSDLLLFWCPTVALRRTAHVGDDLRGNIAVAPSNSGAAVHVGKDVGSVGYPAELSVTFEPRTPLVTHADHSVRLWLLILSAAANHAMRRLPKTRYQNWPTETGAEIRVFVLEFETRRQGETSGRPRVRALFKPRLKLRLKQVPAWLRMQS